MAKTNEGGFLCMKPRVCILKTDGTNCDNETVHSFEKVGADAQIVLLNQLRSGEKKLSSFEILVIPGGFSYGDDIASGKLFALELMNFLSDQLHDFIAQSKLIIGICNGFQVLVRAGLLPYPQKKEQHATLLHNNSGKFECRWISLIIEPSECIFMRGLVGKQIKIPVAHGEGKFFATQSVMDQLESDQLVVARYASPEGVATDHYPDNPNGSLHAIAGVCDSTGRIFGLMPHPERFIYEYQSPFQEQEPAGITIFSNAISYMS